MVSSQMSLALAVEKGGAGGSLQSGPLLEFNQNKEKRALCHCEVGFQCPKRNVHLTLSTTHLGAGGGGGYVLGSGESPVLPDARTSLGLPRDPLIRFLHKFSTGV